MIKTIKKTLKRLLGLSMPIPQIYKDYKSGDIINLRPWLKKYNIGDFSYGSPVIYDFSQDDDIANRPTTLKIGKFCSIADIKIVLGSEHRVDWVTTYPFNERSRKFRHIKGHPASKGDVVIGNDVWIATNVTILSGVTIGNGAVVGANSLVIKDIPPYCIAAGVPAKIIKQRFSNEIIVQLEEISWWNLPIDVIEKHMELLLSSNIEVFISQIKKYRHEFQII